MLRRNFLELSPSQRGAPWERTHRSRGGGGEKGRGAPVGSTPRTAHPTPEWASLRSECRGSVRGAGRHSSLPPSAPSIPFLRPRLLRSGTWLPELVRPPREAPGNQERKSPQQQSRSGQDNVSVWPCSTGRCLSHSVLHLRKTTYKGWR